HRRGHVEMLTAAVRPARRIRCAKRLPECAQRPWIIPDMLQRTTFYGRRAASLENAAMRVTVLEGGGHIAAVTDKASNVSPLWVPPWPSIEPSAFRPEHHDRYGAGADGRLLAGIMGHNLCLDIFGGPSAEEEAAGLTAHGE